ncbi:MAG TPA: hypothetical protein VMR23_11495 [Candidatus Limnocylindria bacterium]|nr:hypothetical protein [Candidatus Limnocylindria bacterium]
MLIRRCAWHRSYNGYPMLYGITAWRQRGLGYTDGMCRRCAATALQAWGRSPEAEARPRPVIARLRNPAGRAGIAVAAACILTALAVTAAARRDGGDGELPASALPRAATGSQAGPFAPASPQP